MPKAKFKSIITVGENELRVCVTSNKFARFVRIESTKSTLPLSDNSFDLLPGQSVSVSIKKDSSLSLTEQAKSIRIYSLCDIKPCADTFLQRIKSRKVFLSLLNIGNAFYHGRIPADIKQQDIL
ncbi:MAG: hypothetical protein LUG95_02905 [Clostridiales bacterium]|nr:hypothetical protein [Clostridiales bacterium]